MIHRIDRHITKLIALELRQTKEEYEEYFSSPHEAFALLMEEFCEAENEFNMLDITLDRIWEDVMDGVVDINTLYEALKRSKHLISEATQTAAMVEKFIESAEEKGW